MTSTKNAVFQAISGLTPLLTAGALLVGCSLEHHAPLRAAELPPLAPPVLHASRLWIDVRESTSDTQCVKPGSERLLCFEHVQSTFRQSLRRSLWTSFPEVAELGSATVPAGDYLLVVELGLDALPPDASGPGWSAGARSKFQLFRDGKQLLGEALAARSRPEFAYGAPLGLGASEAVQAIAARVGIALDAVPETREIPARPLPAVAVLPLETAPAQITTSAPSAAEGVKPSAAPTPAESVKPSAAPSEPAAAVAPVAGL
jgi:hypothetical protein